MSYQNYVTAAYGVFAVVMLWDFIAPRMRVRQQLRAAKMRAARVDKNKPTGLRPPEAPLARE